MMMMITDMLKRLGTIGRTATDGSKEHVVGEDNTAACCQEPLATSIQTCDDKLPLFSLWL